MSVTGSGSKLNTCSREVAKNMIKMFCPSISHVYQRWWNHIYYCKYWKTMPQEGQGMRKSFHQSKYLRSKCIGDRTQKTIWLGTHQHMPTIKFFKSKCFQFDDPKSRYFATSVLLRISAEKSQKDPKTTDLAVDGCFWLWIILIIR